MRSHHPPFHSSSGQKLERHCMTANPASRAMNADTSFPLGSLLGCWMNWRKRQFESERINRRLSRLFGLVVGAIHGATLGLLISLALHQFQIFFPYDIIFACTLSFALIGFICGERIVDFLKDIIQSVLDSTLHGPD